MSEESDGAQAPNEAPAADAPGGDDDMVTMSRADVDRLFQSARNSAFAEARKTFKGERPAKQQQQPTEDPRVKRGLELLQRYESAYNAEQERQVEYDARMAASPFGERVMRAIDNSKVNGRRNTPAASQPAQAPQPQQGELGQLLELMKLDIQSRLADKLPKPAPVYASPGDQAREEMNSIVADIRADETLSNDQQLSKIQGKILSRLRNVRITPGAHNPNSRLTPTKKG